MAARRTRVDSSGRVPRRQLGHVLIGTDTFPLVDLGDYAATDINGATLIYHAGNLVKDSGVEYLCVSTADGGTTTAPPSSDWIVWDSARFFLNADRIWKLPNIATSRYSDTVINDPVGGLVLYWKLDELGNTTTDVIDSSGNGHTGTYGDAPFHGTTDHPTLGVSALADGTAAEFDGLDDMLGIYTDVPSIQGFGEMSVEFWMKSSQSAALDGATSLDTTHACIVSSDSSSSDGRFFRVAVVLATGQLLYVIFGTDATGHSATGSAVVNDGLDHYIACTFDGTDMKIYVDGVLDVTATPSMGGFPLADHNHGIVLGGGWPIAGPFVLQSHYHGILDEFALYTAALPIGSIETHFLIGGTASNPPSGTAGGVLDGNFPDPGLNASVAGAGLAETSDVLSVNVDGSTIEIAADTLRLKDAGPGATGPIGDATHTPVITIDAKGRVSALTSATIAGGGGSPTGAAGGDLTGTYPNPTLATAGPGAVGPIGDATHVAAVTTDAKGRVSALTSVAITYPTITDVTVTEAPGSDLTVSGIKISVTAGEALAFGDPVYIKSDGKAWIADANTAGKFPAIGIATATAAANGSIVVLLLGMARKDAWSWTVGGIVYLSTSSGLTQTLPSATDDCTQVIGIAEAATRIYVNPQLVYITHV